jgi:hypothetical protein
VEDEAGKEEEQGLEHGAVQGRVLGLMGQCGLSLCFGSFCFKNGLNEHATFFTVMLCK